MGEFEGVGVLEGVALRVDVIVDTVLGLGMEVKVGQVVVVESVVA